jgi:hypothetical protein
MQLSVLGKSSKRQLCTNIPKATRTVSLTHLNMRNITTANQLDPRSPSHNSTVASLKHMMSHCYIIIQAPFGPLTNLHITNHIECYLLSTEVMSIQLWAWSLLRDQPLQAQQRRWLVGQVPDQKSYTTRFHLKYRMVLTLFKEVVSHLLMPW